MKTRNVWAARTLGAALLLGMLSVLVGCGDAAKGTSPEPKAPAGKVAGPTGSANSPGGPRAGYGGGPSGGPGTNGPR